MIDQATIDKHTITVRDRLVVFEENNQKFIVINNNRHTIKKIRVDGGVVNNIECCDYIAGLIECEVYVELKGSNIKKACSQLLSTIHLFRDIHKWKSIRCAIVHTRYPAVSSSLQTFFTKIKNATGHLPLKSRSPLTYTCE